MIRVMIIALLLGGCTTRVIEPFKCDCACKDGSVFSCKGATGEHKIVKGVRK